jgi:ABC-type phosphate transport system substrate-binding protein
MQRLALSGLLTLANLAVLATGAHAQNVTVDPKIPEYKPVQGVSGSIKSVGSDTLNNLMSLWAESFKKNYPAVSVEVEGKGSGTAPPALINGSATFGPMSRLMKQKEIDDFEKAFGYKPTAVPAAVDTLAVYVHKDNPLKSLSLEQIDAIFSKDRKGQAPKEIRTWGELGLTANGPTSRSRSTAATRPRAPTASSRSTRCSTVTSRTPSRSRPAARPSCRAWPRTATRSATAASVPRRPTCARWRSPRTRSPRPSRSAPRTPTAASTR